MVISSPTTTLRIALAVAISIALVWLVPAQIAQAARQVGGGGGGVGVAGVASSCPAPPASLSKGGTQASRYTMLLRVNKISNVDTYANADESTGGLRGRITNRDIFVVNTRFVGSTPEETTAMFQAVRDAFPCNRIIALNGLGADPAADNYRYQLTNQASLYGVGLDWELDDWRYGQKTAPGTPPWELRFRKALGRMSKYTGRLGSVLQSQLPPAGRKTALVPTYYAAWDYGRIAKAIDKRNSGIRDGRRGFQIVQTQAACDTGSDLDYGPVAKKIVRQYKPPPRIVKVRAKGKHPKHKFKKVKRKVKPLGSLNELGFEVSFSNTPDPRSDLTIGRVPPSAAAKCTRTILAKGGGAVLYWATPDSVLSMLKNPKLCFMRPPVSGGC